MALGNMPQQTMEMTMADKPKTTTSVDAIDREIHSVSTQGNQTVRVDVTYPYLDRESITITETIEGTNPRYPYNDTSRVNSVVLQRRGEEQYAKEPDAIATSSSSLGPEVVTNLENGDTTGRGYLWRGTKPTVAAAAIRRDLEGILDRDEARGGTVRQKMIEEGYEMPPQMRDLLPASMRDFRDLPGGEGDAPSHGLAAAAAAARGKGGRGE